MPPAEVGVKAMAKPCSATTSPKRNFGPAPVVKLVWMPARSIAGAYAYTAGKKPYGYSGLGDISVLLFFGIAGVVGTAALISGQFDWRWTLPALTIGLFSVAVLNLNNLRDHVSDAATGKHTLVVRMGFETAKRYHAALLIGGWLALLAFWQVDRSEENPWTK